VRLKLPALVGYLIAGVAIGPHTPGFVADADVASQLADIGVMLLMFGIGLHFSLKDLLSVGRIAVPGALVQMLVATALGTGLALLWGWGVGAGIVLGLSLSVASTVVFLKAIESQGPMDSVNGHIAIGWLVVQDLIMVLVLVLLPALADNGSASTHALDKASEHGLFGALAETLGLVAVFIGLMLVVGRRVFPWLLWQVARTGSRELFTLCVVAAAVGIAYISSAVFGVSFALGAFFAGMVLRESKLSYRAAQESLPLQDAFAVLFFVSVGMLFDPSVLIAMPLHVLAVVGIIVIGKSIPAFVLVLLYRYPLGTALTVSASLAQIGEFSFILAGLGTRLGVLPAQGLNLILAGALISITINPLVFKAIEPAQRWIRARSQLARALERSADPLAELPMTVRSEYVTGHVVLVGYGRVGRRIAEALTERQVRFVIADENRELIEKLRERGAHAVAGNASDPAVLIQAHVARAAVLVIAIPDTFHVRQMIETARMLNPGIETVVRTHSDDEAKLLRKEKAGKVFMGEHELAIGMARYVLEQIDARADRESAA
jgi:monovalent cation:H+ antiporter-2, CPA2 family